MKAQVRVLAAVAALTLGGWMTSAHACSETASSCSSDKATSVVNVSNPAEKATCPVSGASVVNVANKEAKSSCAASCDGKAASVVNVSNTAKEAGCPAAAASVVNVANREDKSSCAASCDGKAASVVNVSNPAEKATCGDAATPVVNVANKEAKSSCATACADGTAQYVRVVDTERTNGFGGAGEVASRHYDLGDTVSDFTLLHVQSGEQKSLSELAGEKGTVIIFWNQSCPWVFGSPRACQDDVVEFAAKYAEKGVNTVLIDAGIENTVEEIKEYAEETGLTVPLLVNRDSSLAAKFRASYTPESFILNSDKVLVYKGAYHVMRGDSWHNTSADAVEDIIAGQLPAVQQARGRGCTIKWAPGSRPAG